MLTKPHRLLRTHNFEEVFKKGKKATTPFFVVYARENGLSLSRFAIVVSLKVSKKAVERNLVKRRIRSFIHIKLASFKKGYDVIIRVQGGAVVTLPYQELEKELIEVFSKAHLFN
ncbi:MAG: ribonuclease P protein component [Parcubacteria group bacterium]|nr:ribonuclease P protein component [Parcubacteria group bacterium]